MAAQELLIHTVSEFARTLAWGAVSSDVLDDLAGRVTAVLAVAHAGVLVLKSGPKGVLAAERHIPVDEAFDVLRRHARSHAVSLRSVAEAVAGLGLRP